MRFTHITILLAFIFCVSCTRSTSHSYRDDEIPTAVVSTIYQLNQTVLDAVLQRDTELLKSLTLSQIVALPEFEPKMNQTIDIVNSLGDSLFLAPYHDVYTYSTVEDHVIASCELNPDTKMFYFSDFDTTFASFTTIESGNRDILVTLVYVKESSTWKIMKFELGILRLLDQDAVEWFSYIKDIYKNGYPFPSYLYFNLVNSCLDPSSILEYNEMAGIQKFQRLLGDRYLSKIIFPSHIPTFNDNYNIYGIRTTIQDQIYPVILYTTELPISAVSMLEDEAHQILPGIERKFKGMTKAFEKVIVIAHREPPVDPSIEYESHRTVVDLKSLE